MFVCFTSCLSAARYIHVCVLHIPPCLCASHFVCLLHSASHHVYVLHTYLSKFCAQQVFCAKSTLWVDFAFSDTIFVQTDSYHIQQTTSILNCTHTRIVIMAYGIYMLCSRKLYWLNLSLAIQGSREQDLRPVQRDHLTPRGDGRPEDLAA